MKNQLLALLGCLVLPALLFCQTDYLMWETMYIKPDPLKGDALESALGKHNKAYHATAPYDADIWYVVNGPHSGELVWIMGPTTYTQHDDRPANEAHDNDWSKNVVPNTRDIGAAEYWKMDKELSFFPADFKLNKMRVWIVDVKGWEGHRFRAIMKKIREAEKASDSPTPYGVYWNDLNGDDGRDAAIVWFFDKWSWLDEDENFSQKYEEVHGQGSWRLFLREWEQIVTLKEQELRQWVAEMSGSDGMVPAMPEAESDN